MNFKNTYRKYAEHISPSEELVASVLKQTQPGQQTRQIHGRHPFLSSGFYRYAVTAAVFLLMLNLSLSALTAHAEPVYQIMFSVSPVLAQHFMPVHMSSEDQGIRMEVESISLFENTAEIYISMQDLTGDRIDETIDLYDSYSINRPFDSAGTCQLVDYDEDSGKAIFYIHIDEVDGHRIEGDKITFSVREFLSHKSIYDELHIPLDLTDLPADAAVMETSLEGMGGSYEAYSIGDTGTVLLPGEPDADFSVTGIDLTAAGYIDGRLHIQTATKNLLDNDNHGFLYLKDAAGNTIHADYNLYFLNHYEEPGRIDYQEYVFDIPKEEISQYTLYGDFVTCETKVEGNWQVTFSLENL